MFHAEAYLNVKTHGQEAPRASTLFLTNSPPTENIARLHNFEHCGLLPKLQEALWLEFRNQFAKFAANYDIQSNIVTSGSYLEYLVCSGENRPYPWGTSRKPKMPIPMENHW